MQRFAARVKLPLHPLLARHGIAYHLRQSNGKTDKGGKAGKAKKRKNVWIGATLTQRNGNAVFSVLMNGGPAELAGIAPGDVAVALDGLALTTNNWSRRLATYQDGDTLNLLVFRGDELISTEICLAAAPVDTCYLEMVDDADVTVQSRLAAWLQR